MILLIKKIYQLENGDVNSAVIYVESPNIWLNFNNSRGDDLL